MFAEEYAKHYVRFNCNKPYEDEVKFVYEWAGKPRSILDLGCGPAHYWEYFPKGIRLVGIEKSPAMIGQSWQRSWIINDDITAFDYNLIEPVECVTALFDVMNYVPSLDWVERLPLESGGFFIFDMWDAQKAKAEGFHKTTREVNDITRVITPLAQDDGKVSLQVALRYANGAASFEVHDLYLWTSAQVEAIKGFEVVEIKPTDTWQVWWKLRKK